MDWKEYEQFVFENVKKCFPNSVCEFNSKILGKYSKGLRQCDVIVRITTLNKEHLILIDAKYYSKKIDVKDVEEFISMSNDINADEGILVTPHGYSKLAYERAENDPSQILLDILNLEELKRYQGFGAIPYSGEFGVLLQPAFGWIIDSVGRFGNLASSYRKGFDFEMAWNEKEFIYFNIWHTQKDKLSKVELLEQQTEILKESYDVLESNIELIIVNNKELAIRKTRIKDYLSPEYACAITFENFIFFGILLSENNRETVNLSKLIHSISTSRAVRVQHN